MTDRAPDALLADTRWLRRLTRGLVRDRDLAEDVAQETLLAAQKHPAGTQRSWLARVARNLAVSLLRREARRTRAESAVSSNNTDTAPPPDELLAEAELQRAAVDALMELEEPYRRTLLLRFMKGLSPRAVARQMNVPLETVRTRQKRGLAQLRARLDQRAGGRLALILPLVVPGWPFPSTATLWGFVLMKTKVGVACAALLMLAAMFGVVAWAGGDDGREAVPPASVLKAEGVADETPATREGLSADGDRQVVATDEAPPPKAQPVAETGSLLVRVLWKATGRPAGNVCVRLVRAAKARPPGNRIPKMMTTGQDGTVRFASLEPGKVAVASDRQYDSEEVDILAGRESQKTFTVEPGVDVRGIVVNSVGNPVAGAEVVTMFAGLRPAFLYTVATTRDDGRFSLRGMNKFNRIGARKPGVGTSDFVLLTHPKPGNDGVVDLHLALSGSAATLRGVVLDATGAPLPAAWVKVGQHLKTVKGSKGFWTSPPINHVATDADGGFEVDTLRPGANLLRIFALGHAPYKGEVVCDAFRPNDVTIRLTRGSVLVGKVIDEQGYPVEGADVNLPKVEYPTKSYAKTDARGAFQMVDLPAGPHLLMVKSKTAGSLEETIELPIGKTLQKTLTVTVGRTIRGVLVDERGNSLPGWWLSGYGDVKLDSSKTDSDGRFRFNNCKDQAYDLAVRRKLRFNFGLITVLRGVRPDSKEKTYRIEDAQLPSAMIRGRVFASDGKPLKGATVWLKRSDARIWGHAADTNAEGRFETVKVSPATYDVMISHIQHVPYKREGLTVAKDAKILLEGVVLKNRE